jgi:hypothetical protein
LRDVERGCAAIFQLSMNPIPTQPVALQIPGIITVPDSPVSVAASLTTAEIIEQMTDFADVPIQPLGPCPLLRTQAQRSPTPSASFLSSEDQPSRLLNLPHDSRAMLLDSCEKVAREDLNLQHITPFEAHLSTTTADLSDPIKRP